VSAYIEIAVLPEEVENRDLLERAVRKKTPKDLQGFVDFRINKRSIDARRKPIVYRLRVDLLMEGETWTSMPTRIYQDVSNAPEMAIIGMGPAGMFAALACLEMGVKPVIYERGKEIRSRRRDLVKITRDEGVDADSNYCFGEGGAGTFSDGKLYTRSKKRGDVLRTLETLVQHGAKRDILVDAHPHIGTNKLPEIIEDMRETILSHGGEIHFNARVTDFEVSKGGLKAVHVGDKRHEHEYLILATGHSARDIFDILKVNNLAMEFKSFALGCRIEHPQELIDEIQYHCKTRGDFLPPAAYSVVQQVNGRGVYSFCMCPGGIIAPCATDNGEVVTNGWSPSKRNNPFANSGIVTEVRWEDVEKWQDHGALAGVEFQKYVEKTCWEHAGQSQLAPAQRMIDFIKKQKSVDLPPCSYKPGVSSVELNAVLPDFISESIREALVAFGKKMPGYLTNEAILVAPESRTSCPVRIPRDIETLEHPDVRGFYPCGEGAGYAGGIISAAIDGEKVARKCVEQMRAAGLV
jgi:uncharacterized protein